MLLQTQHFTNCCGPHFVKTTVCLILLFGTAYKASRRMSLHFSNSFIKKDFTIKKWNEGIQLPMYNVGLKRALVN